MKILQKRRKAILLLIISLLLLSGASYFVLANQHKMTPSENAGAVPGFGELMFKTLVLLGFIIILIYVILYLLRRFVYKKNYGTATKAVKVLQIVPLIAKKSLCVIKVVDRILVIGISESGISKLSEIDEPERQQKWISQFNTTSAKKSLNFAEQLQGFLGHQKN